MTMLATVRKLLTPSRSPIEITGKLAGERSEPRLHKEPVTAGVDATVLLVTASSAGRAADGLRQAGSSLAS
jgi:hypothetical protein